MLLILFTLFHFSDIRIRLSRNKALGTNQETNEVCGHKFVLATRNESWGRADLDTLGKSSVTFHMLTTGINRLNRTPIFMPTHHSSNEYIFRLDKHSLRYRTSDH